MKKTLLIILAVILLGWSMASAGVPTATGRIKASAKVEKAEPKAEESSRKVVKAEQPAIENRTGAVRNEKAEKKAEPAENTSTERKETVQKKQEVKIDQALLEAQAEAAKLLQEQAVAKQEAVLQANETAGKKDLIPEEIPMKNGIPQTAKSDPAQFITTPAGIVNAPGIGDNPPVITDIFFTEDFETGALPDGWSDVPGTLPWLYDGGTDHGPNAPHGGSYAAYFNIYDYAAGTIDSLITPSIDLSAHSGSYMLSYWSWHSSGTDSMVVFLSEAGVNTRIHRMPNTASWNQNLIMFNSSSADARILFVGYSRFGSYNIYIDDIEIRDAPTLGRCCYGDPVTPSCDDNSSTDCAALNGTWNPLQTCAGEACPAVVRGENCVAPFIIESLPYTDTQNTANWQNDYGHSGRDVVYELTITERTLVDITTCNSPDPTFDDYIGVWGPGQCGSTTYLASTDGGCDTQLDLAHISDLMLTPGTYYILVEAYFSSSDGEYVLEITGTLHTAHQSR